MYTITKNTLNSILKRAFSSLVGKSCKRIEIIRDNEQLCCETKINLIRDLIKELDYETMRSIEETVEAFSDGTKINVTIQKPSA